jgi:hypothetical protein
MNSLPKTENSFRALLERPSAFVPIAMSLIALALVVAKVLKDYAAYGSVVHEADEGTAAHLWQLLMAGQTPVLVFFAIKWLPRAPQAALCVLGLQAAAVIVSVAPVFFLHL